jgi:hypothetical protein
MEAAKKSLLPNNAQWSQHLGHSYFRDFILAFWPNLWVWRWYRQCFLKEHYSEVMNDAIGAYCAGGEL